jgi:transcriptional regulator with XRE-family HTH domain
MTIGNEIKAIIIKSGWTLTDVAKEMNRLDNTNKTVQNLSSKIRRETIKYDEVKQIANIIGYEIKWVKKQN